MNAVSAAFGPPISSGWAQHRRERRAPIRASSPRGEPRERARHGAGARAAKVTTPQPSTAVGSSRRVEPGRAARRPRAASSCSGWPGEAVARERPAVPLGAQEHPRVLARAVVRELRAALGPALELLLGRAGAARGAPGRRRAARAVAVVRGAGDRELLAPAGPASSSASGSAWNGFATERMKVTSSGSPAASTTSPSRTATACTACLDSTTPPRSTITLIGDPTWRSLDVPELPEIEALRRSLDEPVRAAPIEKAGPGAHRDAQDLRPAALGARGPAPRGRAQARQAPALPDGGRRARPARPPDVGRPARLLARGREAPEGPGLPARLRGRRGARLHGGRGEEARPRRALHPRGDRGGARAPRARGARPRRRAARRDPRVRRAPPPPVPARPARARRDRPRLVERDPPPRAALALRALDRPRPGGGRAARRDDRRGAHARASRSASRA